MEDSEAVERRRDFGHSHIVVTNLDVFGVPAAAPVESSQLERVANNRVDGIPILNVKKVNAVPKYTRFIIILDPKSLSRM
jgi:hypothetical protein